METDRLGNLYLRQDQTTIAKLNPESQELWTYSTNTLGIPMSVDASNPLEVMIFYRDFNRVVVLDNLMSPIGTINLESSGITDASAIARADDKTIWVYDRSLARLINIDRQANILSESLDLTTLGLNPEPVQMWQESGQVYVWDSTSGLMIFDRYARYLKTIPLPGAEAVTSSGNQIFWTRNDSLFVMNLLTFQRTEQALPVSMSGASILLRSNRLTAKSGKTIYRYTISIEPPER